MSRVTKSSVFTGLLYVLLPLMALAEPPTSIETLNAEAVTIVKRFAGILKPKLMSAMQAGGPVKAVSVCSDEAPAIAKQLSKDTQWVVKRVSLKPRNNSAAVDDWERVLLEQFDQRQNEGELPAQFVFSEIVDGRYRFIKAQVVEGLCLNCHGQTLSADVRETLNQYYPNDQATGYLLGEIRGAFSLSKEL